MIVSKNSYRLSRLCRCTSPIKYSGRMRRKMAEHKPQPQQRQMVRYLFYKLDPAWRRLPASEQAAGREQLAQTIDSFARRMLVRSYSLMGTRGDADFMFWLCHP